MAEYIEREVALSLVKPDAPEDEKCAITIATAKKLVRSIVYRTPAADVTPVVRCRDCKSGDYDSKPNGAMVCLRTNDGFWRKETDFCSYGEPKEERENGRNY